MLTLSLISHSHFHTLSLPDIYCRDETLCSSSEASLARRRPSWEVSSTATRPFLSRPFRSRQCSTLNAHAHVDAQSSHSRMWWSGSSAVLSQKGRRILAIGRGRSWVIRIQRPLAAVAAGSPEIRVFIAGHGGSLCGVFSFRYFSLSCLVT